MKKKIAIGFIASLVLILIYMGFRMHIGLPTVSLQGLEAQQRQVHDSSFFSVKNNWLRQNKMGLWEMHVEGSPIELGYYEGLMSKDLIYIQEEAFVQQIKQIIPSEFYLSFLKYFIGWFNRDIDKNIIEPFKEEIYGVSLSSSHDFDFVAKPYQRLLNYHGAHDIGHALSDLALVGCTSFIANQNRNDPNMVVGRNFDFYISDDFARNKMIAFVKPDSGYQFAYITWASFIGVVSGMNSEGLTVTINAAKSDVPTKAKTPISLLAREILQFASNTKEAIAIAKKRDVFVSESILVSSAKDDKAIIIEKSPADMDVFEKSGSQMVSSNHFQGEVFKNHESNIKNKAESASLYRQIRCEQLMSKYDDSLSVADVSAVLRDTRGIDGEDIGLGNEKAMNQLISHHSVIFLPKQLKIWVSTSPYQLGKYLCYDLNEIFKMDGIPARDDELYIDSLNIAEDSLLFSKRYADYKEFKLLKEKIKSAIKNDNKLENEEALLNRFVACNPKFFYTYEIVGNYYANFEVSDKAAAAYEKALTLEISNKYEEDRIKESLSEVKK